MCPAILYVVCTHIIMLHKYLTNSNGTGDGEMQNTRSTDYEKEHLRTKNYELN